MLAPGGGGINVARAIKKLGGHPVAVYPSGGYNGDLLNQLLEAEQVPAVVIETCTPTRENIIVAELEHNRQYRLGMPGATLTEKEWQACIAAVECHTDCGFIVASGSIPPGVPDDVFAILAKLAKRKNARLVVDTKGAALMHAVNEGAYLIKPNFTELCALSGVERTNESDAADIARKLIRTINCANIVVSMGAYGAILVTKTETFRVPAPQVEVKGSVGAGDSMVAGIIYSLHQGNSVQTALQYGVACGTAATLHPGTGLCIKQDVDQLYHIISCNNTVAIEKG